MNDDMVIVFRLLQTRTDADIVRGTIQESCARDHCGRLRQPCGIPVAGDFAAGLITRPCAAVESIEAAIITVEELEQGVGE